MTFDDLFSDLSKLSATSRKIPELGRLKGFWCFAENFLHNVVHQPRCKKNGANVYIET